MSRVREGDRVGNFVLLRALGRGGFGAVYEAREEKTGRSVAIKVLLPEHARDPELARRFHAEARAAAAVSHPHIAVIHATGQHEGRPYIVFELVPGGTLDRLVAGRKRLPWREACARGAEVASALAALHGAGIIHRDLKPENVLLDEQGRAKLSDFGLVRFDRGQWHSLGASLTEEGEIMGTFAYMSPEQANGARDLDARADLYSLGALIFTLLTGRPPFEGRGVAVLSELARKPAPSPRSLVPDVPEPLDRLVLRLLSKDREVRPADARSVQRALEEIWIGGGAEPTRSKFLALALLLAVLAPGLVALGVAAFGTRPAEPLPEPAPPAPVVSAPRPEAGPSPEAQALLASALQEEREGHAKRAIAFFEKAAEAGHWDAMFRLALALEAGHVVAKDERRALALYERALALGKGHVVPGTREAHDLGQAAFRAGCMLQDGRGRAADAVLARRLFEEGVALEDDWARKTLAEMLAAGTGGPRDERRAVELLVAAAGQGNASAMIALGDLALREHRDEEAALWYRRAGDVGEKNGKLHFGILLRDGRGVAKDEAAALALFLEIAEAGSTWGMVEAGFMYQLGRGVEKDEAKARLWYRKAMDAGQPAGALKLAFLVAEGLGGPRDEVEARRLYEVAVEGDDTWAMVLLGDMLAEGRGGERDDARAVALYRRAEPVNVAALARLGEMLAAGRGAPRDDAEAVRFFERADAAGEARGTIGLAGMLAEGRGVAKDEGRAVRLYTRAAERGYDAAMLPLAAMLEEGRGTPRDVAGAIRWYRAAAASGNEAARAALRRLGAE
ncbi:MAG TPA: serine/threonine-protein kinase [Planctomycetota bacterium]|nr:serine/threonine-protein kinase [Planctomycetota bacterium]